jgi:hypothetical protein
MNPAIKYAAAIVGVPVISVAIYLGAVIQVYILAWVIEIIGRIT